MKMYVWILAATISFIGCGAPYATMKTNGLQYRDFDIIVPSVSEYKPRFINNNWSLENWLEQQNDHSWHRKKAAPFIGDVFVDVYANGSPKKIKKYYYELYLDHDGTISSIIVDVTTASTREKDASIEDMYKTFVDNMAAKEPWYAGNRFVKTHVDKQAKITPGNYKPIKVGDYEAVVGYVERSLYDSNDKNADMSYAIFLLKLTDIATVNRTKELAGTKENIPVILTVVLEAETTDRDSLVDDFYELLGQIQVKHKSLEVEYINPKVSPESVCTSKDDKEDSDCKSASSSENNTSDTEDVIGPQRVKKNKSKTN